MLIDGGIVVVETASKVRTLKNYINGKWVVSKTSEYEEVVNPATKDVL